MKLNRLPQQAVLAALAIAVICAPGALANIRYKTSGAYTDRSGGQHAWSINESHTLLWENQPYIPVGTVFVSKYAGSEATDANYQADTSALTALKAAGITDIIVKMGKPITSCDPAAVQKIVDYLDENGFAYGIEFDDGPKAALSGYTIAPHIYKLDGPTQDTTFSFDWPDVDAATFFVINKATVSVRERGGVIMKGGKATIKLSAPISNTEVLIVYPLIHLKNDAGAVGDLWSGFGEYRDRVLAFFQKVKFGAGLRFFLEPFTSKMDFNGDAAYVIPDSAGFRLGFEGYLLRKYVHEGGINTTWATKDDIASAEKAARMIPLWSPGRGLPYLYDKASAQFITVDPGSSSYWRDAIDFRDTSAQEYMNTIADTLTKNVANVPVIFKSASYHRVYANPFAMNGYHGLGVDAYGTGEAPAVSNGGNAYSLAEESTKCTWLITSGAQASAPGSTAPSTYPSQTTLTSTLDSLREVGCKGFYVNGLADPSASGELVWLKSFKDKLKLSEVAQYRPTVINFPYAPVTGAYVKRIAPDTWWLPTLRVGKTSNIGPGLCAYTISGEGRAYVWSNSGAKSITLKATPSGPPPVEYPAKGAITVRKKDLYTLNLTDAPIVLRGVDFNTLFPRETADACIAELSALIPQAEKDGKDVTRPKMGLTRAKSVLENGQAAMAYGMAKDEITRLTADSVDDIWVEGEQTVAHNFGGPIAAPGASEALVLSLDTQDSPLLAPYTASYSFESKGDSSYEVWIAGSLPADSSPATFCLDDTNWAPIAVQDAKEVKYAPGLAWYKIGHVNAFTGKHVLKIKVEGRRPQDNRYYFAVDAIVLSPKGFTPNGVIKP